MLRALFASALLILAASAGPAAADHRDRSSDSAGKSADQRERAREYRRAKHERWKRQRYVKRYYYSYPYTPWWGPFPGPPGL